MAYKKPIANPDISGFEFIQEMLNGDNVTGINFDTLYNHESVGYVLIEYLLCEEDQIVTPYSSHPNRYWHLNKGKFISLFNAAKAINGRLYLVNYAKKGTQHEDKVKIIYVKNIDPENGITEQSYWDMTRSEYSDWLRKLNSKPKKIY